MTATPEDPLRPLHVALDALDRTAQPLPVFLRDDDAGWDDARLMRLLDLTADAGVPIDLAAIPLAVGSALAQVLRRRFDASPDLIGIHQHGTAHLNHQREGRSCEFGSDRDAPAQRADLMHGRELLLRHFGHRLDPFFTPPWNRCAPHTPALLAELGFAALSRDRGAPAQQALPELPVDVDWSRHHRAGGAAAVAEALAAAIAARRADARPLGLMLHHAAMVDTEFDLLRQLLPVLAAHPGLRLRTMRSLVAARRPGRSAAAGLGSPSCEPIARP